MIRLSPRHIFPWMAAAGIFLLSGDCLAQAREADGANEGAVPSGPPNMIPPPPPNITPPALPPNLTPPPIDTEAVPKKEPTLEQGKREEMAMLERFLNMPPETLAKIRRTLERIEKMTPEQKEALLARIREFRRMDIQRRRQFLNQFEDLDPREGRALVRYLFNLPSEQREAEVARVRAMSPDERRAFLRELREQFRQEQRRRRLPGNGPAPAENPSPSPPN